MTNSGCPHCGQPMPTDPVAAESERIRRWAAENGIPVLLGDCIRQADAARYLGRAPKTLQNWAATDERLPARRLRGRVYHDIEAIARLVSES